jgi:hypothetical protein
MARRATLTQEALVALGPDKLAKLVVDEAGRNAGFKRIVNAALAGARGPDAVAAVVNRRLVALQNARGFIDWEKRKAFVADLRATLATITDELGAADPVLAAEHALRFLGTAERVFERVDDSTRQVQEVYWDAAEAVPALVRSFSDAEKAKLPDRLMALLHQDDHGLIETVLAGVVPLLPSASIERLDAGLAAAAREIGPVRADERDWQRRVRLDRVIRARQAIADQRGDVDAFIALESSRPSRAQDTLGIAERLLAAGRACDALEWVRRSGRPGRRVMSWEDIGDETAGHDRADRDRVRLEIRILEALGDSEAAQTLRWKTFEATLDGSMLRDYLAHLPDFGEFDALDRAFAHAAAFPHRYTALAFFLGWPRRDLAAKLVLDHLGAWDGRHYGALAPAAEALEDKHPAAATVLYRALIDDVLARARSSAYGHAARYLARLDAIGDRIVPPGLPDHAAYKAELQRAHGRKTGFWGVVDGSR